ncbi:MAG TPA: hypothetical protein VN944_12245, partial [Nitrospiria bacterium]|nr:hypothetical protein [Nitrospiria bacterium]
GLSASPLEVFEVGKSAHARGLTVLGIRLEGHGTRVSDLDIVKPPLWIKSLNEGISCLKQFSGKIVIAGLSLGALVTLRAAENGQGDGIIVMSAPMILRRSVRWAIALAGLFGNRLYRPVSRPKKGIYYPEHSIPALKEMEALARSVTADLARIIQPILIMQSEWDNRASPESGNIIYNGVRSRGRELVIFSRNDRVPHVLTGPDNPLLQEVTERIIRFSLTVGTAH